MNARTAVRRTNAAPSIGITPFHGTTQSAAPPRPPRASAAPYVGVTPNLCRYVYKDNSALTAPTTNSAAQTVAAKVAANASSFIPRVSNREAST